MKRSLLIIFVLSVSLLHAEDGYDLWLRYTKIENPFLLKQYRSQIVSPVILGSSQTMNIVREEFKKGISGLLDNYVTSLLPSQTKTVFMIGAYSTAEEHFKLVASAEDLKRIGSEGFIIKSRPGRTYITANTDIGVLYGLFHYFAFITNTAGYN